MSLIHPTIAAIIMTNTPEYSPIYLEIVSALGKARIIHTTKRIGTSSTAMQWIGRLLMLSAKSFFYF